MRCSSVLLLACGLFEEVACAADLASEIAKPILAPRQAFTDSRNFIAARITRMPVVTSSDEWRLIADRVRQQTLDEVVFKGDLAKHWRDEPLKIEWLGELPGGEDYRIKTLRFQAVPGVWIPAVLYEPLKLADRMPVFLNVNGHDGLGTAAPYKQILCINQVKRGMIVLNVEWLGMGQLRLPGWHHGRLNQLDLCGASGLSVFYLAMQRGLDVLLSLPQADPTRVGLAGLSGGGWQTALLAGLDPRVTLSNPVAGYSSFLTRLDNPSDHGDSEQTPVDLGVYADYAMLTALRAPQPTLLTYNVRDDCCFASAHALPPLMEAAAPIFSLLSHRDHLQQHVNTTPGTHNFDQDNREALYRMQGRYWYPTDKSYNVQEIPVDKDVKTRDELNLPLPAEQQDFNTLAKVAASELPRIGPMPTTRGSAEAWQIAKRRVLEDVVRFAARPVTAEKRGEENLGELRLTRWIVQHDGWHIPACEISSANPRDTVIVVGDGGRASQAVLADELARKGSRVVVVDLYGQGEQIPGRPEYLHALMIGTAGERPLGVMAGQLAASVRWCQSEFRHAPRLVSVGPRTSLVALTAAALEPMLTAVELREPRASLKQLLEENLTYEQATEAFCFGLLEQLDLVHIGQLIAPRAITIQNGSPRSEMEFAAWKAWWSMWQAPAPK